MAKRYYWLKLQDGFFGSKRIKKLRKLAGGDTFTIIYLKMQLLSIKTGGVLEYTGLEDTFAEELALDIDEESDNVAVTVNYLLSCGLLETKDNREFMLPYAIENTGSEGSSAKRMRDLREKQALLGDMDIVTLPSQCDTSPSQSDGEIEKDKDKEIEIEKKGDKSLCQQVVDLYHTICKSFPSVRSISESRKKAIKVRLKTYSMEDFKTCFENAENSAFLKGANDRNWTATFDWLIKDANMAKVLDGNYADKPKSGGRKEVVPAWMNKPGDFEKQAVARLMGNDLADRVEK